MNCILSKGKVSRRPSSGEAAVTPHNGGTVTPPLAVPDALRGDGGLEVGTEVLYVLFGDGTGLILSRMDGRRARVVEFDEVVALDDVVADGVSLKEHRHSYTHGGEGSDTTGAAQGG